MHKFLKEFKAWKKTFLMGLLILTGALFLRTYNLTHLPIFADEAIYLRWAQVMRAEPTLRFLPLSDGKQPLFMWSVIPFLKLFSDPLVASRMSSVVTGLITLLGVFTLSYLLFKSKVVSLVSLFIYSLSPYAVFFDRIGLVDSMLTAFGVWTMIFLILTAKTLRLDVAMFAGFTLGAALLTKSPALFFIILLPTTALFVNWPKDKKKRPLYLIKLAFLWAVALIIAYLLYNILRLGPNFHLISQRNQDYVLPINHLWTNPKDPFIFHIERAYQWFRILAPWTVLLLAVLTLFSNRRESRRELLVLFLWFLFPMLVQSMYAKAFTTRYVLFTLPYLVVASSASFATKTGLVKRVAVVTLLVFIVQSLALGRLLLTDIESAPLPRVMRSGYLEEWTSGTGIKEVADIIKSQAKDPTGQVVVGTEGYFGTLPDGLQAYLNNYPDIIVIGIGLGINKVPDQLRESKKAGNKTYLVANSSRLIFKGNFEDHGLRVVAAYPKAFRPEGLKEYVQYGPRDTLYLLEVTSAN